MSQVSSHLCSCCLLHSVSVSKVLCHMQWNFLLKKLIHGITELALKSRRADGTRRRWRKSKMRRSLSSPQIYQKYIYTWNCSYRTPTECWQKTSDLPKGKKLPTYLGRAKGKTETKEQGRDLHQWDGAVKEERCPHTRKAFLGRRLRVTEGESFAAVEESTATGVRRAKRRDSRTEDQG